MENRVSSIPNILQLDAFVDVILLVRLGVQNLAIVVGEAVTLATFALLATSPMKRGYWELSNQKGVDVGRSHNHSGKNDSQLRQYLHGEGSRNG